MLVAIGLSACHKEQDVVPTQTNTNTLSVNPPGPGIPIKLHRLTQVGKMKVQYTNNGIQNARIQLVHDDHHLIQYDYQGTDKILISPTSLLIL